MFIGCLVCFSTDRNVVSESDTRWQLKPSYFLHPHPHLHPNDDVILSTALHQSVRCPPIL